MVLSSFRRPKKKSLAINIPFVHPLRLGLWGATTFHLEIWDAVMQLFFCVYGPSKAVQLLISARFGFLAT